MLDCFLHRIFCRQKKNLELSKFSFFNKEYSSSWEKDLWPELEMSAVALMSLAYVSNYVNPKEQLLL